MPRPRIRSIKPEAPQDERIGRLSRDARLLFFTGLVTMADDEGRLRAMPSLVIGHAFPYDDDVTPTKLRKWLDEIEREGLILRYESDGVRYVAIRHWARHQRINRAAPSVLPAPPDPDVVRDNAVKAQDECTTDSLKDHGENTEDSLPRAQARVPDPILSSPAVEDHARADVTRVCGLLAERILANDPKAKADADSKRWRTAARLLLDTDGRSVEEVEEVIEWCQADPFWQANVLSMPKLREKFAALALRMRNTGRPSNGAGWTAADMIALGKESA